MILLFWGIVNTLIAIWAATDSNTSFFHYLGYFNAAAAGGSFASYFWEKLVK